ncbi:hypothetical protein DRO02_07420 [archaeon]|nr:MAG: hypothetical protein DRO02_07420 [archaeon]
MKRRKTNIILLLGSYDPSTKKILEQIKNEIAKISTWRRGYMLSILLGNTELYELPDDRNALVELNDHTATIFIGSWKGIEDVIDVPAKSFKDAEKILKERYGEFIRIPVLEKLVRLATASSLVFVVRHEEFTRGGEYIELAFIAGRVSPEKIYFLANKKIKLSTMLEELLEYMKFHIRYYESEKHLLEMIYRIIYHDILSK